MHKVILIHLKYTESVRLELTPSSVNVCTGESVTLKCTIRDNDRNNTRWTIISRSSMVPDVHLDVSHLTTELTERFVPELDTNIRVERTSFSPLCTTFMTNATTALDGVIVKCSINRSVTESLTITVRGNKLYSYLFLYIVDSSYSLNQMYQLQHFIG